MSVDELKPGSYEDTTMYVENALWPNQKDVLYVTFDNGAFEPGWYGAHYHDRFDRVKWVTFK